MQHRVLIIGVGSIGERHVRCFQRTGRAAVSILEINSRLGEQVAQRYQVPADTSLEAAIERQPTAAVICAPAHLHIPLATSCVSQNWHVLIEKPLSTGTAGLPELQQLVREKQRVAAVAYVLRFHPVLRAMKRRLDDGRLGAPRELISVSGQHFPTYRPAYREIYYNRHETGGGAIQDALTHALNAGEWLVGPIERLVVDAGRQVLEGVEVEDTVHLLARQGSVLSCYALNQHQAPNEYTLTVVCERGTLRAELHRSRCMWTAAPDQPWQVEAFSEIERDSLFVTQANAFLDAMEGKWAFPCLLAAGIQSLAVNQAALASWRSGAWQSIPDLLAPST